MITQTVPSITGRRCRRRPRRHAFFREGGRRDRSRQRVTRLVFSFSASRPLFVAPDRDGARGWHETRGDTKRAAAPLDSGLADFAACRVPQRLRRTDARTHARTHARMHACTHSRRREETRGWSGDENVMHTTSDNQMIRTSHFGRHARAQTRCARDDEQVRTEARVNGTMTRRAVLA